MSQVVNFGRVSLAGLETSPHAKALAGLRANEARYFKNKYDHASQLNPRRRLRIRSRISHILKAERGIEIALSR